MTPAPADSDYLASGADLHTLRRFLRAHKPAQSRNAEYCQMCNAPIAATHRHLLDLAQHGLLCSCDACALLFTSEQAAQGKYRLIPRRVLDLQGFQMNEEQWEHLQLPVNLLYLYHSTEDGRARAFYPGPAGAIESLLELASWETLVRDNPILRELEPDVEALLIDRITQPHAYYLVPIDACYRLAGLLRVSWQGLRGGEEVWKKIADFFQEIKQQAILSTHENKLPEQAKQVHRKPGKQKGYGNARTRPEL